MTDQKKTMGAMIGEALQKAFDKGCEAGQEEMRNRAASIVFTETGRAAILRLPIRSYDIVQKSLDKH
jgi:hypothetical protein